MIKPKVKGTKLEKYIFLVLPAFFCIFCSAIDEWISMNSSRLRPVQSPKKPVTTYSVGEKCMARWTDSRKFPATVQKVLENSKFQFFFCLR